MPNSMISSYELLSRLRAPLIIVGEDGSPLFQNEALGKRRGGRISLRRSKGRRPLFDGTPCFRALMQNRREIPALCLPWEGGTLCLLLSSAEKALLLLTEEEVDRTAALLSSVFAAFAEGRLQNGGDACRLAAALSGEGARLLFSDALGAVASLCFRMLFSEPLLTDAVEGIVVEEPLRAYEALGLAIGALLSASDEGLPLSASLALEEDELLLTAADATFSAGPCRVPTFAEAPEPFSFYGKDASLAFTLAASVEAVTAKGESEGALPPAPPQGTF